MRLDRLHIKNFRCYEDATFDFQPGFNLVVGVNGSGKTSLLHAVATCFSEIIGASGHAVHTSDEEDVRVVIKNFENGKRFEKSYPLILLAEGMVFNHTDWKRNREKPASPLPIPESYILPNPFELIALDESTDFPILAFYRSERRWKTAGSTNQDAATLKISRLDAYRNWSNAATSLSDFESWIIKKTLEQLQKAFRTGVPLDTLDDELTWVNSAIEVALPNSKGVFFDVEVSSLLVDMGNGKVAPFSSLSDGQRGIVALFTDIARRMCILNPHLGKDVLKKTTGIVIIDELDIHLHPAWQRSIAPALQKAFPKIQFIAASHSPQIIGSLKPEEVIVLNDGDSSHPRVTYGLDSSRVLEEVMDVAQREPEIEALLLELFSTLEDNDLEKAKLLLQALKEQAPDLPEYLRAEALMRRKEIIGR